MPGFAVGRMTSDLSDSVTPGVIDLGARATGKGCNWCGERGRKACRGCWKQIGWEGWMEGKPEAPVRGGSVRVDEGSGLCPRVYGAGLDPTKGSGWDDSRPSKPQANLTSWTDCLTEKEWGKTILYYSKILFYVLYCSGCTWHTHTHTFWGILSWFKNIMHSKD